MDEETMDGQESLNPEGESEPTTDVEPSDNSDEVAKAKEVARNQEIRAKKAEAELKRLKAQKTETETPKNDTPQSNEPDYAKEAFLEQRGVEHAEDKKIVYDEAKRLKLPLTDVLSMAHIKAKLKDSKDQREAESGLPDDKGKPTGSSKNDVNYWLDRKDKEGNLITPDDLELANKVIDARIKKEKAGNMFSSELWN